MAFRASMGCRALEDLEKQVLSKAQRVSSRLTIFVEENADVLPITFR